MGMILKLIGFVVVIGFIFKFGKRKLGEILGSDNSPQQIQKRPQSDVIEICPNCGVEMALKHRCR